MSVSPMSYYREDILVKTYTVNTPENYSHFVTCSGVLTHVGVNGFGLILQNHSTQQPHACVNTPENVTRWEYFLRVFDCICFLT